MQFTLPTWQEYGQGDINNNRDAILAAARLLQAGGAPGDMRRALRRYNNSNSYVNAVDSYAQLMLADERAFLGYYHVAGVLRDHRRHVPAAGGVPRDTGARID